MIDQSNISGVRFGVKDTGECFVSQEYGCGGVSYLHVASLDDMRSVLMHLIEGLNQAIETLPADFPGKPKRHQKIRVLDRGAA